MDEALKALATGGPVALVIGYIAKMFWDRLQDLRLHYEGDDKTQGLLAKERAASLEREDDIRARHATVITEIQAACDARLRESAAKNDGLLTELLDALKNLE